MSAASAIADASVADELAAAIAALPQEDHEPVPARRREIQERRRVLEAAAQDIALSKQLLAQVERRAAWVETRDLLTSIAGAASTDSRTRELIRGTASTRDLVPGGYFNMVESAARAAGLNVPQEQYAYPLPTIEPLAADAIESRATAKARLKAAIAYAAGLLQRA
jgi:hypothetical protein